MELDRQKQRSKDDHVMLLTENDQLHAKIEDLRNESVSHSQYI